MNIYEFLVASLSVLVTALIGWDIIRYALTEKRMESIASNAASLVTKDIITSFDIGNLLSDAKKLWSAKKYMKAIDILFTALEKISSLRVQEIREHESNVVFPVLLRIFEESQEKGGLWILQDQRYHYECILQALSGVFQQRCFDYLHQAEEHPESEDGAFWDGTMVVHN